MTEQTGSPRWVRILGDDLIYTGPCLVTHILMNPDANQDYADVYDGRDTTSGKLFCRLGNATRTGRHLNLGAGVHFENGIYIDAYDSAVETTVVFIPLESGRQRP